MSARNHHPTSVKQAHLLRDWELIRTRIACPFVVTGIRGDNQHVRARRTKQHRCKAVQLQQEIFVGGYEGVDTDEEFQKTFKEEERKVAGAWRCALLNFHGHVNFPQ